MENINSTIPLFKSDLKGMNIKLEKNEGASLETQWRSVGSG